MITRHILTVRKVDGSPPRKVHYRRCGKGPVLLMVHQSPRSSAEYEPLMEKWSKHFTCIAPDSPGFGQSDPLPLQNGALPDINAFADATGEFIDALGIAPTLAYGFHSGAIILMTALKRNPSRFRAIAMGGYAVWTQQEMAIFGEKYLPEFHPAPYGQHLAWLWHRVLEQSWFFPWFHTVDAARLPNAHADTAVAQGWVDDFLEAGDAYRAGYGAVLRAPRDIPPADASVPPCLITAYDGDPLQPHIDRLGEMPAGWDAYKVTTPEEHHDASLAFLREHSPGGDAGELPQDDNEGWVIVDDGLIHWKGERGGKLVLHAPASQMGEPAPGTLALDAPGHGYSSDYSDMQAAVEAAAEALGASDIDWPAPPSGDPELLYPDLTPDRFGTHLHRAWAAAREEAFFTPWYAANREHAIAVDQAAIAPAAIHERFLARLRAGHAARHWHDVLAAKVPPVG